MFWSPIILLSKQTISVIKTSDNCVLSKAYLRAISLVANFSDQSLVIYISLLFGHPTNLHNRFKFFLSRTHLDICLLHIKHSMQIKSLFAEKKISWKCWGITISMLFQKGFQLIVRKLALTMHPRIASTLLYSNSGRREKITYAFVGALLLKWSWKILSWKSFYSTEV